MKLLLQCINAPAFNSLICLTLNQLYLGQETLGNFMVIERDDRNRSVITCRKRFKVLKRLEEF
jgi:hypothetical protein